MSMFLNASRLSLSTVIADRLNTGKQQLCDIRGYNLIIFAVVYVFTY